MPNEPMEGWLKPNHFHDLGKLMFAFVMLWAYFNFSQYLLTYAANLVEETPYMIVRTTHGWQYLALFLVVVPLLRAVAAAAVARPQAQAAAARARRAAGCSSCASPICS